MIEEKVGTFTITAAKPSIRLTAETENGNSVHLYAQVDGVRNGSIPLGSISFYQDGTIIKAQEKLVYGEADTVVSGLKQGGSYQFKAVYEPDDKDGQTYYETVTSEAATVTIKEDSSTGGSGTTGGGSSSGGGWNNRRRLIYREEVEQPEAAHLPEAVERPEAAHLPEEVPVAEILRVVALPEGEHHPTEIKPMQKHRLTEIQLVQKHRPMETRPDKIHQP